jgi:hypothetical protein
VLTGSTWWTACCGQPVRTRYGSSRAHAERRLREALRDRGTGQDQIAGMTSRLSDVATLWLAEVDDSDLGWGTKRLYRFAVESYVLPGLEELRLREVTVPAVDRLLATVRSSHGTAAAKCTRSVLSGILGLAVRQVTALLHGQRPGPREVRVPRRIAASRAGLVGSGPRHRADRGRPPSRHPRCRGHRHPHPGPGPGHSGSPRIRVPLSVCAGTSERRPRPQRPSQ